MATYDVDVQGTTYEVDAPDPNTAWRYANQHHRAEQVKLEEAGKANPTKLGMEGLQERGRQTAEGVHPLQRALLNFYMGAGNVKEGLMGLTPWGKSKGELEGDKRVKAGFAEATPGGEYVQMAGEIAPTLLVPGGAVGGTARAVGARAIPRLLQRSLAARAADIGLTGAAVGAATTPGDLEDRLLPGALGAVGGAIPVLSATGKGASRLLRGAGKEASIAERVARDVGPDKANELIAKLGASSDDFTRAGVRNPTAAQLTRDPMLQQTELGLRVQRPDLFAAVDDAAAQGRWGKLGEIAQDEAALNAATGARKTLTDPLREGAITAAREASGVTTPLRDAVEAITTGESRTNPQALTLANWVKGHLDQGVTPEQLYTMRKTLTSGIPRGTELGSAMTQARAERVALVKAIDEGMDKATGGRWSEYMKAYQGASEPITQMKAGQAIQGEFASSANRTPAEFGDVPRMTPFKLRQALEKHGQKQFGAKTFERLSPEQRETVESIARSIEAEHAARTAQGTIGSGTAGNLAASERSSGIMRGAARAMVGGGLPGVVADETAAAVGHLAKRSRQEAFARLMQDPVKLRESLAQALTTIQRDAAVGELSRGTRAGDALLGGN